MAPIIKNGCFRNMRYTVANILFRLRFPRGWIQDIDFRPHFDGHLLNVVYPIPHGLDEADIEARLSKGLRQSYRWMRRLRCILRQGDRVQYCLGTLHPRRQYLKACSTWEDLANGVAPRDVVEYWRQEA